MIGQCGTCVYHRGRTDDYTGQRDCRRYPPQSTRNHSHGGTDPVWPRTQAYHECGEYKQEDEQ